MLVDLCGHEDAVAVPYRLALHRAMQVLSDNRPVALAAATATVAMTAPPAPCWIRACMCSLWYVSREDCAGPARSASATPDLHRAVSWAAVPLARQTRRG